MPAYHSGCYLRVSYQQHQPQRLFDDGIVSDVNFDGETIGSVQGER